MIVRSTNNFLNVCICRYQPTQFFQDPPVMLPFGTEHPVGILTQVHAWIWSGRRFGSFAGKVAGGQTVAVGQVTETDTAQAVSWNPKRRLITQAISAEIAQPITVRKTRTIGQVTETDLAQPVTALLQHVVPVNQVTETDLAQPIAWAPKRRLINLVSETGIAQPITVKKTRALAQAVESDTAQSLTDRKTKSLGLVTETDLAQALTHLKRTLLGQASETDLAQPVSLPGSIVVPVNPVSEADLAQPVAWAPKRRLVNQITETDAAQPLTRRKLKTLGIPIETDLAQALTKRKLKGLGLTAETDLAQVILWSPKRRIIGQVVEVDLAQPVTVVFGERLLNIVSVSLSVSPEAMRIVSVTTDAGVRLQVRSTVYRAIEV